MTREPTPWYLIGWERRYAHPAEQIIQRGLCGAVSVFAQAPEGIWVPILDVPQDDPPCVLPRGSRR